MKNNLISQKGSIMIEALAMLGLIAMVTPVLYRKAAERTTELEDINVASQIRMVSQAVDAYLKDNYTTLKDDTPGSHEITTAEQSGITGYLPEGFNLNAATKLFNNFRIAIKKEGTGDDSKFTSAVVAALRNDMTQSRAAKIASMIGIAGGIYDGTNFQGSQGAWGASPTDFGIDDTDIRNNSLVAISNEAINSVVGQVDPSQVLYRVNTGEVEQNTMYINLHIDNGNSIIFDGSGNIEIANGNINASGITANNIITDTISASNYVGLPPTNLSDVIIDTDLNMGNYDVYAEEGFFADIAVSGKVTADKLVSNEAEIGGIIINSSGINATGKTITAETVSATSGTFGTVTAASGIFDYLALSGDLDMNNNDIKNVKNISGASADFGDIHAHNSLSVGGSEHGDYNRYLYVGSGTADTETTLFVNQNGIRVNADSGRTMTLNDAGLNVVYEAASVDVSGNTIPGTGKYLRLNDELLVNSNNFDLSGDAMTVSLDGNANKMQYTEGNLAIGGSNVNVADGIGGATQVGSSDYSYDGNNVLITRDGVIRLVSPADAPGQGENHGFIEARRLVSDKEYHVASFYNSVNGHNDNAWGTVNYSGDTLSTTSGQVYTTYQVNPAYTSVMNDIKLASRGGARLSDVLPDYINKGIYVAENTTKLSDFNWENYITVSGYNSFHHLLEQSNNSCGSTDGNCITSPWLGFIPTPQCPPGYNKVITIEPFRWNMSEVYEVHPTASDADIFAYTASGGPTLFTANHVKQLGKTNLRAKLSNATGSGYNEDYDISVSEDEDSNHTVNIHRAPLLFQANTWLNSTLQEHRKSDGTRPDNGTHLGWSVIMGFLYSLDQYKDLYELVLDTTYNGDGQDIAWDLFPVFQKQLAGVARVYCSFNRFVNEYDNSGAWASGYWKWGDDTPVYKYDQLQRVRYADDNMNAVNGFYDNPDRKDPNWVNQVNDPSLNYQEAW